MLILKSSGISNFCVKKFQKILKGVTLHLSNGNKNAFPHISLT